jgi:hypothetical protein
MAVGQSQLGLPTWSDAAACGLTGYLSFHLGHADRQTKRSISFDSCASLIISSSRWPRRTPAFEAMGYY